jgi:hypothetical protein
LLPRVHLVPWAGSLIDGKQLDEAGGDMGPRAGASAAGR